MTMREKSVLNFVGTSATLQHLPVYHELICCKYKIQCNYLKINQDFFQLSFKFLKAYEF